MWLTGDATLYDVNPSGFSATGGSLQNGANDFELCWDDVSSEYVGRADDTFYHWNASGVELPTISAQPAIPVSSWNWGAAMYRGRFIVYNHATNSLDAYSRTGALTESVVLSDHNVESYGISVANHQVWVSFASEWRAYDVLRSRLARRSPPSRARCRRGDQHPALARLQPRAHGVDRDEV